MHPTKLKLIQARDWADWLITDIGREINSLCASDDQFDDYKVPDDYDEARHDLLLRLQDDYRAIVDAVSEDLKPWRFK